MRTPGGIILPNDGAAGTPAYSFASESTLGFYRSAAGIITLAGGTLRGKGATPIGSTHMFLVAPTTLGSAGTGTGWEYLELDGSTWPIASFPDLANALGVTTGTTFTLPNMIGTGRFPRARRSGVSAGTAEANTTGPHTHPDFTAVTATENSAHKLRLQRDYWCDELEPESQSRTNNFLFRVVAQRGTRAYRGRTTGTLTSGFGSLRLLRL